MNRNKNIVFGMLALVVSVVAIGLAYAGFTGTLNVNGTGNVVSSKWDIYFNNLSNAVTTGTANVVTPATISPKTKIGDYYVELATPGDSVTYTFDVVNDGSFDAVLTTLTKSTPTCIPNAVLCGYINYELKYTINQSPVMENDILKKNETKNMTLKLTLDPNMPASALSSSEISVSGLGITLLYSQASSYNGANSTARGIRFVNRQVANSITEGDELAIEDEHFYVVSSDASETVLLSKYNLLVGDVFDVNLNTGTYTKTSTLSSSDTGYGLQNSTARGFVDGANQYIGIVAFSGTNYWDNSVCQYSGTTWGCTGSQGLNNEYTGNYYPTGNPYPEVYRSTMSSTAPSINYNKGWGYAQNNGYTIAYYVEEYVNTLKTLGAPSTIEGRLLTYEEMHDLFGTVTYTVTNQNACTTYFADYGYGNAVAQSLCSDSTYAYQNYTLGDMIIAGGMTSSDYTEAGLSNVSIIRSVAGNHLYNTSFWLGSSHTKQIIWSVISTHIYGGYNFGHDDYFGVRPVIVVPTSSL